MTSFEELGLSPALCRVLKSLGYTKPTPVQASAIPLALAGRDLMAGAQTGTGKTAAFALPLLAHLNAGNGARPISRRPRSLIITPTRELAAQVHDSVRQYGRDSRVSTTTVFGGVNMGAQIKALRRGVDVLVATPGRLIDHMGQGTVDLSAVEILVLDEADRMLDMGFMPDLRRILSTLPEKRQTLLFSATFPSEIKQLARQFQRDPEEIQIAERNSVAATVTHRAHAVDHVRKKDLLVHLLAQESAGQTLVFNRTKHGSDRLCRDLTRAGFRAAAIHGNKSQNARTRALKDFKTGRTAILVATDIAARGLDIDQLPMVVNYDMPTVPHDYVHRIGRTGRAGAEGVAVSLVCHEQANLLRDVERLLKQEIDLVPVSGFEPAQPLSKAATPARRQRKRSSPASGKGRNHRQAGSGFSGSNPSPRPSRGGRGGRQSARGRGASG